MLQDLVRLNRSYRRFDATHHVSRQTLRELVDLARLAPSGANRQALRFFLSADPQTNARIYPALGWAGYLNDWPGPDENERPGAYIVIVQDSGWKMVTVHDTGIAAQTIMLGAAERGLGGCMIGNIKHDLLRSAIGLADKYEILLVLALGKPVEEVVVEGLPADGSIKYWRDAKRVHHVPKRDLDSLILE